MSQSDEKTWALLSHVGAIFFGFLAPLVIFLVFGKRGPFVRHHAVEALNFQLTLLIGYVVSTILIVILIGIVGFIVLGIASLVLSIMAAIAANNGQWYKYPFTIRMVK